VRLGEIGRRADFVKIDLVERWGDRIGANTASSAITASTTKLTTAARLRLSRASASCQSERPAISSAAAGGAVITVMSAPQS
jgi:hypothetical protein